MTDEEINKLIRKNKKAIEESISRFEHSSQQFNKKMKKIFSNL
jgi:hypothetical protein